MDVHEAPIDTGLVELLRGIHAKSVATPRKTLQVFIIEDR